MTDYLTNPQAAPETAAAQPSVKYGLRDALFALTTYAVAYFFTRIVFDYGLGLGATVFTVVYLLNLFLYFADRRELLRPHHFAVAAVVAAASLLYTLYGSSLPNAIIFIFSIGVCLYLTYDIGGNRPMGRLDAFLPADLFKAVVAMPFCCFFTQFAALAPLFGKNARNKKWVFALIGVVIVFPVFLVVVALLGSADSEFELFAQNLIDWLGSNFGTIVARALSAAPVSLFLFGSMSASKQKRCSAMLDEQSLERISAGAKKAPAALAVGAAAPLVAAYLAFIFFQARHFFEYKISIETISEFARGGFFELCAVAAINGMLLLCGSFFLKKGGGKKAGAAEKTIGLVFCAITLIFVALSIAKIAIYTACFGLTALRFYSFVFALVLGVAFALAAVNYCRKINFAKWAVLCALLIPLAFFSFDIGGFIANGAADRYLEGREELDFYLIGSQYAAGVPATARILEKTDSQYLLEDVICDYKDKRIDSPLEWSLRLSRAVSIAKEVSEKVPQAPRPQFTN